MGMHRLRKAKKTFLYSTIEYQIVIAHPVHCCETSCFAQLVFLARIAASCRNSCFLLLRSSMNAGELAT